MAYSVELEGFEGQNIEVKPASFFAGTKLFVNGEPALKGPERRQMILRKDDGTEVIVAWKSNPLGLDPPVLVVGKKMINIIEPLKWHDWVWVGLPIIIIIIGGNIGAIVGLLGFHANTKIFYSELNKLVKYVLAVGITIAMVIIHFTIMEKIPSSLMRGFDG